MFSYPPKEWRGNANRYGGWQEAAAMKYTVIRHNLTALDLSKKPGLHRGLLRPRVCTIQCRFCTVLFIFRPASLWSAGQFLSFSAARKISSLFSLRKAILRINLCRWTLCYRKGKVPPPSTSERGWEERCADDHHFFNTRFFVDDGFLRLTSSVRGFNPCSVKLRLGTWRRLLLKTYPAWAGAIRKSGKLSKQFFRNKMCVTLPSMMEWTQQGKITSLPPCGIGLMPPSHKEWHHTPGHSISVTSDKADMKRRHHI